MDSISASPWRMPAACHSCPTPSPLNPQPCNSFSTRGKANLRSCKLYLCIAFLIESGKQRFLIRSDGAILLT
uniref:Uncharacterized protein n=1 Tax=Arundo donax TaxID=35708 RepID=A0A0A9EIK6_ARUDO